MSRVSPVPAPFEALRAVPLLACSVGAQFDAVVGSPGGLSDGGYAPDTGPHGVWPEAPATAHRRLFDEGEAAAGRAHSGASVAAREGALASTPQQLRSAAVL